MPADHAVTASGSVHGGGRSWALLALLLLAPAPTVGVLCAMVWEPTRGTTLGQVFYGASKVWILALPLLWRVIVERQRPSVSPMRHGGLGAGLVSGIAIAAAIFAGYWFIGRAIIDPDTLLRVASQNHLHVPMVYALLAVYLTLVNSLLEEYVWRWFVYRQCERLLPGPWSGTIAVALSAALFTLHHVIALKAQFGWDVTLLGSAGVFIGGCTWSALYHRYRSIWPGYVSHILADVAVFTIGALILFA